MEGHLFVQCSEEGDFVPRYFVLQPFSGLRYYMHNPVELGSSTAQQQQMMMQQEEDVGEDDVIALPGGDRYVPPQGWIFGGDVELLQVRTEKSRAPVSPDPRDGITYCFVLHLRRQGMRRGHISMRLAAPNKRERDGWVVSLRNTITVQKFLVAAGECQARPPLSMLRALMETRFTELNVHDRVMALPVTGALVVFAKSVDKFFHVGLRQLNLTNVGLDDAHTGILARLLPLAPALDTIVFAHNRISSDGLHLLVEPFTALKKLKHIDLTSNKIDDTGCVELANALESCRTLRTLMLGQNAIAAASMRALANSIAGPFHRVRHLHLTFSLVGDMGAALVALLLTNQPSYLRTADLGYCGVTNRGGKQLAAAIRRNTSARLINLVGNLFSNDVVANILQAVGDNHNAAVLGLPSHAAQALTKSGAVPVGGPGALKALREKPSFLALELGGISGGAKSIALTPKQLRQPLAIMQDRTRVGRLVLRRKPWMVTTLGTRRKSRTQDEEDAEEEVDLGVDLDALGEEELQQLEREVAEYAHYDDDDTSDEEDGSNNENGEGGGNAESEGKSRATSATNSAARGSSAFSGSDNERKSRGSDIFHESEGIENRESAVDWGVDDDEEAAAVEPESGVPRSALEPWAPEEPTTAALTEEYELDEHGVPMAKKSVGSSSSSAPGGRTRHGKVKDSRYKRFRRLRRRLRRARIDQRRMAREAEEEAERQEQLKRLRTEQYSSSHRRVILFACQARLPPHVWSVGELAAKIARAAGAVEGQVTVPVYRYTTEDRRELFAVFHVHEPTAEMEAIHIALRTRKRVMGFQEDREEVPDENDDYYRLPTASEVLQKVVYMAQDDPAPLVALGVEKLLARDEIASRQAREGKAKGRRQSTLIASVLSNFFVQVESSLLRRVSDREDQERGRSRGSRAVSAGHAAEFDELDTQGIETYSLPSLPWGLEHVPPLTSDALFESFKYQRRIRQGGGLRANDAVRDADDLDDVDDAAAAAAVASATGAGSTYDGDARDQDDQMSQRGESARAFAAAAGMADATHTAEGSVSASSSRRGSRRGSAHSSGGASRRGSANQSGGSRRGSANQSGGSRRGSVNQGGEQMLASDGAELAMNEEAWHNRVTTVGPDTPLDDAADNSPHGASDGGDQDDGTEALDEGEIDSAAVHAEMAQFGSFMDADDAKGGEEDHEVPSPDTGKAGPERPRSARAASRRNKAGKGGVAPTPLTAEETGELVAAMLAESGVEGYEKLVEDAERTNPFRGSNRASSMDLDAEGLQEGFLSSGESGGGSSPRHRRGGSVTSVLSGMSTDWENGGDDTPMTGRRHHRRTSSFAPNIPVDKAMEIVASRARYEEGNFLDDGNEDGDVDDGGTVTSAGSRQMQRKGSKLRLDLPDRGGAMGGGGGRGGGGVRQRRHSLGETMMEAVRKLVADGKLRENESLLWQGLLGAQVGKQQVQSLLRHAVTENGLFPAVEQRKAVCEAMYARDVPAMEHATLTMRESEMVGGRALRLGQELLSFLLALQGDATIVFSSVQSADHLPDLDAFLLRCAEAGYNGPETYQAIQARDYLVGWAQQDGKLDDRAMWLIQTRAWIGNLMISRDFGGLRKAMQYLEEQGTGTNWEQTPEEKLAASLLEKAEAVERELGNALTLQNLGFLEEAYASAAHLNLFTDDSRRALDLIQRLASSAKDMLDEVSDAVREADTHRLNRALNEFTRTGVQAPGLASAESILETRNHIVQVDTLKNKLEHAAGLVRRNEFTTADAAEIMPLMKRITSMGLDRDRNVQKHLQSVSRCIQKLAGRATEEEALISMLNQRDISGLEEFLKGLGQGRLLMSAESDSEQKEWIKAIGAVCLGQNETNHPDAEMPGKYMKAGYLEKFSRGGDAGSHKVKNWKKRYFVLQGAELTYYSDKGGQRKGRLRVRGGRIQRLFAGDAEETYGNVGDRVFLLALQEGRDLSKIDQDLLAEAKNQLRILQQEAFEEELSRAMDEKDEHALSEVLERAQRLNLDLDPDLELEAKALLLRQQHTRVRAELVEVTRDLNRSAISEVVQHAIKIRIDPNFKPFKLAKELLEFSDAELLLTRMRRAVIENDDNMYQMCRTDLESMRMTLSASEKEQLVAIRLEHSARNVFSKTYTGDESFSEAMKLVRQVISFAIPLEVESTAMALARVAVGGEGSGRETALGGGGFQGLESAEESALLSDSKAPDLANMDEDQMREMASSIAGGGGQMDRRLLSTVSTIYALARYPKLRGVESFTEKKGLMGRRKKAIQMDEVLQYSPERLPRSLLSTLDREHEFLALNAYAGLLVLMRPGDAEAPAPMPIMRSRSTFGRQGTPTDDSQFTQGSTPQIALALTNVALQRPGLRDELYIQLCKQLTGNPDRESRVRGWLLMAVYLHHVPPTREFYPYLRQHLLSLVSAENVGDAPELPPNLVSGMSSMMADGGGPGSGTGDGPGSGSSPLARGASDMSGGAAGGEGRGDIQRVGSGLVEVDSGGDARIGGANAREQFTRDAVPFERLSKDGGITTSEAVSTLRPYKVAQYCVRALLALTDFDPTNAFAPEPRVLADVFHQKPVGVELHMMTNDTVRVPATLIKTQTAFPLLLSLQEETGLDLDHVMSVLWAETGADSEPPLWDEMLRVHTLMTLWRGFNLYQVNTKTYGTNLKEFPVQPPEDDLISWESNVVWGAVTKNTSIHRGSYRGNFGDGDDPTWLMLRRRIVLRSERGVRRLEPEVLTADAYELDPVGRKKLWETWLAHEDGQARAPVDDLRTRLLYSEETRYVNARLYVASEESTLYLLAIQLVLDNPRQLFGVVAGSGGRSSQSDAERGSRGVSSEGTAQREHKSGEDMDDPDNPDAHMLGDGETRRSSFWERLRPGSAGADEQCEINTVTTPLGARPHDQDSAAAANAVRRARAASYRVTAEAESRIDVSLEDAVFAITQTRVTDVDTLDKIRGLLRALHEVAVQAKVGRTSQRYRYLLRRAYLSYVRMWPLFGCHFFEALLHQNAVVAMARQVVMGVNSDGMFLLTAEWRLLFCCRLADIEKVEAQKATNIGEGPTAQGRPATLALVINGLAMELEMPQASQAAGIMRSAAMEVLRQGDFEYGSGTGLAEGELGSVEPVQMMREYLHDYPILPAPPPPPQLVPDDMMFAPPKSRRTVIVEERRAAEARQREEALKAAKAAAERDALAMEQSKAQLHKMAREDEDEDGAHGAGGAGGPGRREGGKRHNVNSALCGVAARPSRLRYTVPPTPSMVMRRGRLGDDMGGIGGGGGGAAESKDADAFGMDARSQSPSAMPPPLMPCSLPSPDALPEVPLQWPGNVDVDIKLFVDAGFGSVVENPHVRARLEGLRREFASYDLDSIRNVQQHQLQNTMSMRFLDPRLMELPPDQRFGMEQQQQQQPPPHASLDAVRESTQSSLGRSTYDPTMDPVHDQSRGGGVMMRLDGVPEFEADNSQIGAEETKRGVSEEFVMRPVVPSPRANGRAGRPGSARSPMEKEPEGALPAYVDSDANHPANRAESARSDGNSSPRSHKRASTRLIEFEPDERPSKASDDRETIDRPSSIVS